MTDISDKVLLDRKLVLSLLDPLRLAYVYALKDSHPEELGDDFKPWKWQGFEIEYARDASDAYRRLLDALVEEQDVRNAAQESGIQS